MSPVTTVALAGALMTLLGVALDTRLVRAGEKAANDCLIAIKDNSSFVSSGKTSTLTCTDGAACDSDGATDGKCVVKVAGCLDVPGVAGCDLRALKKYKIKVKGERNVIEVTPVDPNQVTSVCGAFVDLTVNLKKKGKKPGKRTIMASATANAKPTKKNKDSDKVVVECDPCPTASCVPPTTTTVTTTSTTTTTNPCGNGTIESNEACDPDAVPNGCQGTPSTPFCDLTTCQSCKASCSQLAFTTGLPTMACSFPGAADPGLPPYTGEIDGDPTGTCVSNTCNNGSAGTGGGACTVDGDCTKLADLGSACLYIGGGLGGLVPPGPTPDGSTTLLGIQDCSVNSVTIQPADTGSPRTCSIGPNAGSKHCANGHPGTDGQGACSADGDCLTTCVNDANAACSGSDASCHCNNGAPGLPGKDLGTCSVQGTCGGTTGVCSGDGATQCGCDFDCNGACTQASNCGAASAGVCQPDPSCFFGNPLPINNSGTSTCVLNVVDDGVTGTADLAAGTADTTMPLKSWVYLTGVEQDDYANGNACPICDSGTCNAGPRKGLACATNSSLKTTHDCPPPPHLFLAPLGVVLGPLTTSVAMKTSDPSGIFCPSAQADGGAFGVAAARTIIENGSAAAGGLDVTAKNATLASVFCIPATGNLLIDASANLPGPGATGLAGTVRLR